METTSQCRCIRFILHTVCLHTTFTKTGHIQIGKHGTRTHTSLSSQKENNHKPL